jgi:hypothetical protein
MNLKELFNGKREYSTLCSVSPDIYISKCAKQWNSKAKNRVKNELFFENLV